MDIDRGLTRLASNEALRTVIPRLIIFFSCIPPKKLAQDA